MSDEWVVHSYAIIHPQNQSNKIQLRSSEFMDF